MGGKASFTPAFDAWRFYADGTESGSSPYGGAAQDASVTVNVGGGNQQIHLRVRIQETGGAAGATTDDYGLDYQVNGAGGWTTITASSSRLQADTGSSLTDGSATTNRATNGISDGTGSFVAGEQEDGNGVIEDSQLTASNFTEHVWALLVVAADNSNGDTLDVRVTLNGGAPGMTNSVTPRITISAPTIASGDGSSSGAGAATATGASQASTDGSASGTGTASAVGTGLIPGDGAASGAGAATGDGIAAKSADGAASGTGTASATGSSLAATDGATAGTGTASGIGAANAISDGASSATGAVAAAGGSLAIADGAAAGVGAAAGDGSTPPSDGAASGTGTAAAVGASQALSDGAASATGTATATGGALGIGDGAASGVGAAAGVAADSASIGAASGTGAAAGIASAQVVAIGAAAGVGGASGHGAGGQQNRYGRQGKGADDAPAASEETMRAIAARDARERAAERALQARLAAVWDRIQGIEPKAQPAPEVVTAIKAAATAPVEVQQQHLAAIAAVLARAQDEVAGKLDVDLSVEFSAAQAELQAARERQLQQEIEDEEDAMVVIAMAA